MFRTCSVARRTPSPRPGRALSPSRLSLAALALVAISLVAGPATAQAAPAGSEQPEPWQPVTQPAFTVPAGAYCSFSFHYEPDKQHLESRVLSRYPDGGVRSEEFRGLLIGTTTNLDTGASIQRNASGRLIEEFNPDGSLATYTSHGPVGFGFRAQDNYPQGYYLLNGWHRITFDSAGIRTMTVDQGPEENICETLG